MTSSDFGNGYGRCFVAFSVFDCKCNCRIMSMRVCRCMAMCRIDGFKSSSIVRISPQKAVQRALLLSQEISEVCDCVLAVPKAWWGISGELIDVKEFI